MDTGFNFLDWTHTRLGEVEAALDQWVSLKPEHEDLHPAPEELVQAMRYAVLDGGKRLRPLLVLAAYEAVCSGEQTPGGLEEFAEAMRRSSPVRASLFSESGELRRHEGSPSSIMRAACAVELIHAYSLVHDDMPCMDNDVLRRGKPTVHVQFGQASAMLAGDALQALAFELLTPLEEHLPLPIQARLCRILSRAAGSAGMAGGQAIDLASTGKTLTEEQLQHMHRLKTGALLQASVQMGAISAQASDTVLRALTRFGAALGLAFQVVDDVLDVIADAALLGKTVGKDAQQGKATYVSIMGLAQAQALAQRLLTEALAALEQANLQDTQALQALALMVVERKH